MKKTLFFIVTMFVSTISMQAYADLGTELSNMLSLNGASNSTSGKRVDTIKRFGFVGPSYSVRTPISPINIVAMDPPRLSAGCGGIDMYAGSFSFINADQLVALFRQIMNNAKGLLFKEAINLICPSCATAMSEFAKTVQDWNTKLGNTCTVATSMVNALKDTEAAKNTVAAAKAARGQVSDFFSGFHTATPDEEANQAKNVEKDESTLGNFTWRALNLSTTIESIDYLSKILNDTDSNKILTKRFIMSFLGADITTSLNSSAGEGIRTYDIPESLELRSILYGNFDTADSKSLTGTIMKCAGNITPGDSTVNDKSSCTDTEPDNITFLGTIEYVKNMLYGDTNKTNAADIHNYLQDLNLSPSNPGANSIIYKIKYGGTLNATEQNFMSVSGSLFKYIKETQALESSLDGIVELLVKQVGYELQLKIAESIVSIGNTTFAKTKISKKDRFQKRIEKLKNDIAYIQADVSRDIIPNTEKAIKFVNATRESIGKR